MLERARANDSTDWIQCAADGALALLRHACELTETSKCSCTFAGFQSIFGGKKLTADDDLGDASDGFLKLKRFATYGPKIVKAHPFDEASCGASVHLPQNGCFRAQLVRGNGDFPAMQLLLGFGAQDLAVVASCNA